ncbi:MAG: HAMP domain-containing histidine kinase [Gemmatimonadetes bacterium]|uniref:histidine kinase n=1 Tax=Candidatus Kutchimonas denitrificans TaxID=3056748 RepID=A0AAE4ZBG0_9BACT|nr:HAMP domain-containing histidine kinase [Gemmatimonadota bacterium]NIR74410.1 HAMP domain-containing histidine kinase [Candidatus Kutchimonas denitrificans]NIS02661.1 HAMP domain-containing histidine kinase [Gemmatimonadota bacterium]NIT68536.1 HAMP domain-containing histidine kinase [Gemmatimonadota bacterium]NIU52013.1 hypothetical protein [Gemmatimonadota bacterium]
MKHHLQRESQGARARFVVFVLLVTLVLAGILAYEAQKAARSHRAAATSALRDHAAFVAWQFADHAQSKFDHKIVTPGLLHVLSPAEGKTPPGFIRYTFRLDLNRGELAVRGGEPPATVMDWARDTLAVLSRSFDPEWDHAVVAGAPEGATHLLVYVVEFERAGTPAAARGFGVELREVPEAFGYAFEYPLLPPSLTGGGDNSDYLSVRVLGAADDVLYQTEPQYRSEFTSREYLSDQHGHLAVEVALRAEIVDALIIGGLPRSRLPVLAGLLLLAAGLVAAAIYLLRREVELARMRAEFVSNVSHELRTPLAQIRMFAETLLLGRVRSDSERDRGLRIIDQEARRLSHLVGNILLFSRAERNGMRLNVETTELPLQVAEVLDAFRPLAAAREVEVIADVAADIVAEVDRSAFRQILLNLLDNAVKYGPEGQEVSVGLQRTDGLVRLWVDDQGPGVPREDRDKVFRAFSRLDRERENAVAGTGIGLSVVRALTLQHGGRVWVEAAPGGGARFVVELPETASAVMNGQRDGE